ncbi:DUF262 domain-containing HNH endonuclease family protein [Mucilaginibacter sp.]|uniref:DUF262 domain-containing protein n=1 Tax=Mucilaginibacter sp. TaxID=1882438 RepID=UPI00262BD78C|nr:DUF262 domain-containing HNH endonuclease family protein [Mucilaginibacter sp.]MDB4923035.1 hypothetical protein [Mucilaginibacter sp.]
MSQTDHLLNANTVSFGTLISGDNIYKVPLFQRDYSWNEDNWDDLWLDISNAKKEDAKHYMGSIIMMKKSAKNFDIIDGQQRITTLSIIALACIKLIDELINKGISVEDNKERKDILLKRFIGYKSATSLKFSNKLILNEENDPFYSSYLIQFDSVNNPKKLTPSNKLLYQAYHFLLEKIRSEIYVQGSAIELVQFLEFLGDYLTFIEITVVDELNAYLVFETLNDRGLDLSVTDLLKNYLFSKVVPGDHHHLKNKWNNILRFINYKDFSYFMRYFWISRNKIVTEKELFKAIKRTIITQDDVFTLIGNLELHAELFAALQDPNDDLWKGNNIIREALSELELFNIRQPFPLLLSAYEKLNIDDFAKVCKICSIISFRYSVISGLKTNILERVYNDAAVNTFNSVSVTPKAIFDDLKSIYPSDEIFRNAFTDAVISTKRKSYMIRYILYKIENHISNSSYSYFIDDGTIEHVLPENPSTDWDLFFLKDNQEDYIYRIGNYTILEKKLNKACENHLIEFKLPFYKQSKYKISSSVDTNIWNPQKLKHRQSQLASYAKDIWRLGY